MNLCNCHFNFKAAFLASVYVAGFMLIAYILFLFFINYPLIFVVSCIGIMAFWFIIIPLWLTLYYDFLDKFKE